ncbi:HlyD family secretion protein [Chromobacterium sp. IIBBL 290-4]|uniref:HlyD family secretion protein n=1 Tax=Chromobacterium sp. IIBBL 290-4 TaxID=2953890 RepID=UPI0020B70076|nr:HlyD family efflux transporter periplasmic adaptor subunit [Chromobacterium sp. IIBBL 290-4]UTH75797.1 HlyD family secretion protein [Chromobacterium sp. IIBBL 290-4]
MSTPPTPLFRAEALAHVGTRQFGSIVLARPVSFRWLTGLFTLLALCIVLFFALFSYSRKAQVPGMLAPTQGLIRVMPAQSGVVSVVKVQEGQMVKAGDVLFELSNERASATRGDAERTITALLQARRDSLASDQGVLRLQAQQKITALQRRIEDLDKEVARSDELIALQQRRIALAEQAVQRNRKLQEANFISAAGLQDKQAELLDQQSRLADLQRSRAATLRDQDSNRADLRDLQIQSERDQAAAKRNVDSVEQDLTENEAKRKLLIRASQAGMVSGITVQAGQTVAANQPLANLSPAGSPLEAELYAPSRSAGFVKPGMTVLIRYQAYPYQKFGQFHGTVSEVSHTALRPDELSMPGLAQTNNETLYRVKVKLDTQSVTTYGLQQPLKAGMMLDASVLLEKRKLYEWVLEPLYSITGKV